MSVNLYGLEFFDGLFYVLDYNLWLCEEVDGSLILGLSVYGCVLYGEIFVFIFKCDGWYIECDCSFGVVEFVKVVFLVCSLLVGILLVSNLVVVKCLVLINWDCYGEGWMVWL